MVEHANVDKAVGSLPRWNFRVTIGGAVYYVRQPTLAEHVLLHELCNHPERTVVDLFWALFDPADRPPAGGVTRDTMLMFYVELLLYGRDRYGTAIADSVRRAKEVAAATAAGTKAAVVGLTH